MQEQSKVPKKDRQDEKVKEMMNWTYSDRREDIITNGTPVVELIGTYPLLLDEDEVKQLSVYVPFNHLK